MNSNDSDIVRTILGEAGYRETGEEDEATVVLTNTCAIRDKAEQRVWTRLHQIKKRNNQWGRDGNRSELQPAQQQLVGVLGCMAERLQSQLLDVGVADVVMGPDHYRDLPRRLDELLKSSGATRNTSDGSKSQRIPIDSKVSRPDPAVRITTVNGNRATTTLGKSDLPLNRRFRRSETYDDILPFHEPSRISSFVSIQRGCSNHCSFCIVPHVRGPERSRPVESILDEVRALIDRGVREITLLGQNVNSYHDQSTSTVESARDYQLSNAGFKSRIRRPSGGYWFVDLLDSVSSLDPEVRVRFTSPHPKDYPPALIQLMSDTAAAGSSSARANICQQLHLPAQSGSTSVLSRMRRGYSSEAYLELVTSIRSAMPDVALSTDMIAGFCGETDEEHADSVRLLEAVRYEQAFLFAYSRREQTAAARNLDDNVPEPVKQVRLRQLIEAFHRNVQTQNEKEIGRLRLVLVEGPAKKTEGWWTGRTDQNKRVLWPENECGWDWARLQPLLRFSMEPQALFQLNQPTASGVSTSPWQPWVEEQVRQSRTESRSTTAAVAPGEYAVVQVTEAKGIALRGRLLWKSTLQEFHASEIGHISQRERAELLQSWLSTPICVGC
jgi:MiaB/RimO family radical SAM methylthiotransferase